MRSLFLVNVTAEGKDRNCHDRGDIMQSDTDDLISIECERSDVYVFVQVFLSNELKENIDSFFTRLREFHP